MTPKQEATLKLALEAIEACLSAGTEAEDQDASDKLCDARAAIREALAEQPAQYSDLVSDGGLDPRNKFDQPAQQQELPSTRRWNIERDGDALLVCDGLHDKHDPCEYKRYVPEPAQQQEPVAEWKCPDCGNGQKYDHRGCINRRNWNKGIRDSVDRLLSLAGYDADSSARHQLAMMNFDEIQHKGEQPFGWWNATYNNFFPTKYISSGIPVEESPAYQRGELVPLYASPQPSKPWVGLTDEDWQDIADTAGQIIWSDVKQAIEAKLREKNTGEQP